MQHNPLAESVDVPDASKSNHQTKFDTFSKIQSRDVVTRILP